MRALGENAPPAGFAQCKQQKQRAPALCRLLPLSSRTPLRYRMPAPLLHLPSENTEHLLSFTDFFLCCTKTKLVHWKYTWSVKSKAASIFFLRLQRSFQKQCNYNTSMFQLILKRLSNMDEHLFFYSKILYSDVEYSGLNNISIA